jgi:hypothetical protein
MIPFGSVMSSSSLSRTIATTIFTILASYALWESHAPFKRKQRLRRLSDIYELDIDIRVIVIGNEGHDHLKILLDNRDRREVPACSVISHVCRVSVRRYICIIFGIFPNVGGEITYAYGYWAENSVGDLIEMLMQML